MIRTLPNRKRFYFLGHKDSHFHSMNYYNLIIFIDETKSILMRDMFLIGSLWKTICVRFRMAIGFKGRRNLSSKKLHKNKIIIFKKRLYRKIKSLYSLFFFILEIALCKLDKNELLWKGRVKKSGVYCLRKQAKRFALTRVG